MVFKNNYASTRQRYKKILFDAQSARIQNKSFFFKKTVHKKEKKASIYMKVHIDPNSESIFS